MAFQKMTPERYAALVRAFVAVGGPVFSRVAREARVDRETCKRGWETGWPDVGPWAKPISTNFEALMHGAPVEVPPPAAPENTTPAAASPPIEPVTIRDHTSHVSSRTVISTESAAGRPGAPASIETTPPTPMVPPTTTGTDLVPAPPTPHADGLTPRQRKLREREVSMLDGLQNGVLGLNATMTRTLKKLEGKLEAMAEHFGEVGDGHGKFIPDPHAAKHLVDALSQLAQIADKTSAITLRVIEATRLEAGEAQSISEERTTRTRTEDPATILERMARMAQVALSQQKGKAIADTYHSEDDKPTIDAEFSSEPTPPTPTE